jgi:hypothetical protein
VWAALPGRPLSLPETDRIMTDNLRTELNTYRNRLDELGRFL